MSDQGSPPEDNKRDPQETERSTVDAPSASGAPEGIGPYRIIQKLGEGGMGEVYEAQQEEPVRRRVALKLIKAGMDTRQVVARFEGERQALAIMSHPNIARVFDAGATEQGRPYFVMEFVQGIPITAYCDRHRLGTEDRLNLFMQVCDGVQHAHQKGIIHRDIKPSNVLVTMQDERPVPKIIDFGVAKATQERLTDKTLFTVVGQMVGTIEYMSPEQAELTGLDIDTRSDVYSLGVLLYEILVGVLPFDSETLRQAGFDEIRRKIREDEPPRPSTRFTTLGDGSTTTAQSRRTDVSSLTRQLRGDLDWITMKALEKDRTRRYESAAGLSADIDRHLKHEPVLAGPPSAIYRTGKFVRRHRTGVVAGVVVMIALIVGVVGTSIGMIRATRAEKTAQREAEAALQISDFLEEMFRLSDPNELRANSVTAREILDEGTRRIKSELAGQPVVQARLLSEVGSVYRNLGLYDQASPLLEEALELRREELGDSHPEVARSLSDLSKLAFARGQYDEAQRFIERAITIRQESQGPDHPDVAESLHDLGSALWAAGDFEAAKEPIERALEIFEKSLGPEHPEVGNVLNTLGAWYYRVDEYDRARESWERALAVRERALGPDHPHVAMTLNNLSVILKETGDYDAARAALERTVAIQEKTLGADHTDLASGLNNLAELLMETGNLDDAKPLYERAIAIQKKATGSDHPEFARYVSNLARLKRLSGYVVSATELYQQSLAIRIKTLGPEHTDVAWSRYGLGMVQADQEQFRKAEAEFNKALATFDETLGPGSASAGWCHYGLARVYTGRGQFVDAKRAFDRALESIEKSDVEGFDMVLLLDDYAELMRRTGQDAEASRLASLAAAIRDRYDR